MNNEILISLKLMWQGMTALFAVMSVIALIVCLLAKFLNKKNTMKKVRLLIILLCRDNQQ